MTDHQPSDITKIFADISSESRELTTDSKGKPSSSPQKEADSAQQSVLRHGAHKADDRLTDVEENPMAGFDKPSGIDWSALKGQVIRLPGVGRLLRICMAILRLPKRLDGIMDSMSQLNDQSLDIEHRLHGEISAINAQHRQLARTVEGLTDSPVGSDNARMTSEYFHALAEKFRGSFDDVKAKMAHYVPYIKAEGLDLTRFPAVDLACGRCEWSELMREQGINCTGVDSNPEVLEVAKERNLSVTCTDLFRYLESLANDSIGIVSGFHIIEHLNTTQKLLLFREAKRVLVPGGLLILETPNSENPLVSSHYFYYDPSHLNPMPIQALEFMAQHFGYELVMVLRHSPLEQPELQGDGNAERYLAQWLGREQDYGLIVRKFPGHEARAPVTEGES